MSRWEDLFQNHQAHKTIKEIIDAIDIVTVDASDQDQVEKRRLRKVISAYQDTLSNLDPEIISYNVLDGLNNGLRDNVLNQIVLYNNERNTSNLVSANNYFDTNLVNLSQLLSIAKKSTLEKPIRGLEKSVDNFSEIINSKKEELKKELTKISEASLKQETRLNELSNSIDAKKQETDSLISSWQKQFSDAQNKRNEDFANDQNSRTNSHNTWQKQIESNTTKSLQDLVVTSKAKLDQNQLDFDKSISEYLATAKEKHSSILELYELVAGDSVAAGYLKNADDEKDAANFWRWAAIAFIGLTATWIVISYFFLGSSPKNIIGLNAAMNHDIPWGQLLKTFSLTGVLLFGALYSAKQSNIHRQNEKRTRWFALEVKAIDPFIASLKDEDRKALKNELSKRLFGQKDESNEKDKVFDDHVFQVVIKGITDVLKSK
jgi:hypothetical protein